MIDHAGDDGPADLAFDFLGRGLLTVSQSPPIGNALTLLVEGVEQRLAPTGIHLQLAGSRELELDPARAPGLRLSGLPASLRSPSILARLARAPSLMQQRSAEERPAHQAQERAIPVSEDHRPQTPFPQEPDRAR